MALFIRRKFVSASSQAIRVFSTDFSNTDKETAFIKEVLEKARLERQRAG